MAAIGAGLEGGFDKLYRPLAAARFGGFMQPCWYKDRQPPLRGQLSRPLARFGPLLRDSEQIPAVVMVSEIILLARAWRVAAERHVDQRRKGERAEPYVNHLAEVAELVAEATNGSDPNLVVAAVLHDTIEDTGLTFAELAAEFGTDVADLVAEVTDDKQLTSSERKRLQVEHAGRTSTRAKLLKLADKTSNLRSIANSPPPDWSGVRKQQYLKWAREVVAELRGVDMWLEGQFDEAARHLDQILRN